MANAIQTSSYAPSGRPLHLMSKQERPSINGAARTHAVSTALVPGDDANHKGTPTTDANALIVITFKMFD